MSDASASWAFAERLSRRVEELVESALGAEGSSWASVLARHGFQVTPDGGCPIPLAQVESVLVQVVAQARVELDGLQRSGAVPRDVHRALSMRLDRLVAAETGRYREATSDAGPAKPAGGGLGAIFANVKATAAISPWARSERWKQQVALTCRSCGAPQRESRNFVCAYCGGDLFRRPHEAD